MDVVKGAKGLTVRTPEMECDQKAMGLPSVTYAVFLIHTTYALSSKGSQKYLKYSSETPTLYQNDLAMRNTGNNTGGKPIAV
jgi:hypothetical protein